MDKKQFYILIGVIVAGFAVVLFWMDKRYDDLKWQYEELSNYVDSCQTSISQVNGNISEYFEGYFDELKRAESGVESVSCEYKNIDPKTLTGYARFTVVPKEVKEDTTLSVKIGNEVYPMSTEDGIAYIASIPVGMEDDGIEGDIYCIFDNPDTGKKTVLLNGDGELYLSPLPAYFCPVLESSIDQYDMEYSENSLKLTWGGCIFKSQNEGQPYNRFEQVNLLIKAGGEILCDQKVDKNVNDEWEFNISEKYNIKSDNDIWIGYKCVDSFGYVYEIPCEEFSDGEVSQEAKEFNFTMHDKNGKLVFEGK